MATEYNPPEHKKIFSFTTITKTFNRTVSSAIFHELGYTGLHLYIEGNSGGNSVTVTGDLAAGRVSVSPNVPNVYIRNVYILSSRLKTYQFYADESSDIPDTRINYHDWSSETLTIKKLKYFTLYCPTPSGISSPKYAYIPVAYLKKVIGLTPSSYGFTNIKTSATIDNTEGKYVFYKKNIEDFYREAPKDLIPVNLGDKLLMPLNAFYLITKENRGVKEEGTFVPFMAGDAYGTNIDLNQNTPTPTKYRPDDLNTSATYIDGNQFGINGKVINLPDLSASVVPSERDNDFYDELFLYKHLRQGDISSLSAILYDDFNSTENTYTLEQINNDFFYLDTKLYVTPDRVYYVPDGYEIILFRRSCDAFFPALPLGNAAFGTSRILKYNIYSTWQTTSTYALAKDRGRQAYGHSLFGAATDYGTTGRPIFYPSITKMIRTVDFSIINWYNPDTYQFLDILEKPVGESPTTSDFGANFNIKLKLERFLSEEGQGVECTPDDTGEWYMKSFTWNEEPSPFINVESEAGQTVIGDSAHLFKLSEKDGDHELVEVVERQYIGSLQIDKDDNTLPIYYATEASTFDYHRCFKGDFIYNVGRGFFLNNGTDYSPNNLPKRLSTRTIMIYPSQGQIEDIETHTRTNMDINGEYYKTNKFLKLNKKIVAQNGILPSESIFIPSLVDFSKEKREDPQTYVKSYKTTGKLSGYPNFILSVTKPYDENDMSSANFAKDEIESSGVKSNTDDDAHAAFRAAPLTASGNYWVYESLQTLENRSSYPNKALSKSYDNDLYLTIGSSITGNKYAFAIVAVKRDE